MALLFSNLKGIFGAFFQWSNPNGPQIKNNAGTLEARNAGDSAYLNFRGLDPVLAQDFATKNYSDVQRIYLKTFDANQTLDTTTASAAYVDLLTIAGVVTTGVESLEMFAQASISQTAGTAREGSFRITVDGAAILSGAFGTTLDASGNSESGGCMAVIKPGAGTHTVKLQWHTNAGTLQCRPVGDDDEGATLRVMMVKG